MLETEKQKVASLEKMLETEKKGLETEKEKVASLEKMLNQDIEETEESTGQRRARLLQTHEEARRRSDEFKLLKRQQHHLKKKTVETVEQKRGKEREEEYVDLLIQRKEAQHGILQRESFLAMLEENFMDGDPEYQLTEQELLYLQDEFDSLTEQADDHPLNPRNHR